MISEIDGLDGAAEFQAPPGLIRRIATTTVPCTAFDIRRATTLACSDGSNPTIVSQYSSMAEGRPLRWNASAELVDSRTT